MSHELFARVNEDLENRAVKLRLHHEDMSENSVRSQPSPDFGTWLIVHKTSRLLIVSHLDREQCAVASRNCYNRPWSKVSAKTTVAMLSLDDLAHPANCWSPFIFAWPVYAR